jgi:hypothetical protein
VEGWLWMRCVDQVVVGGGSEDGDSFSFSFGSFWGWLLL